jgi:hypothetical protein
LLHETEKFLVVDCVAFSQATDIQDALKSDFLFLKDTQDVFPNGKAIVEFVESGDVEDAETDELVVEGEAAALIKLRGCGDLFETVGDGDFRVAGEKTGGCGLAGAGLADNQKVIISYLALHKTIIFFLFLFKQLLILSDQRAYCP